MVIRNFLLLGACLALAAGCQRPDSNPDNVRADTENRSVEAYNGSRAEEPNSENSPPDSGAPAPEPGASNSKPAPPRGSAPMGARPRITVDEPRDVQKPGSGGWSRTDLTPQALAKRIAQAFAAMRGTEGAATLYIKNSEGNGYQRLEYKIDSPKRFRVDYVEATGVPSRRTIVSDGVRMRIPSADGKSAIVPWGGTAASTYAAGDPKLWHRDFSRAMLASLVDGQDPWLPLATRAAAGKEYAVTVERRQLPYLGRTIVSYRLHLQRRAPAGAQAESLEIVVDGERWLPVTIRSQQGEWSYEWMAGWKFKQKLDQTLFQVG